MADSEHSDTATTTAGAFKAGDGEHFFELKELAGVDAGADYSSAHGPVVEGEEVQVAYIHMPAGSDAELHTHPNEQFIYVLEGRLRTDVDGDIREHGPGSLAYIPANVPHKSAVLGDEDVYFLTAKDLSHGISGTPVED